MGSFTEDDVDSFIGISGADPYTARQWLQRYNDLQTALGQFFDKGTLPPENQANEVMKWDENMFEADRYAVQGPLNKHEAETHQVIGEDVFSQQPRNTPDIEHWRSGVQSTEQEQINMAIHQSSQETGVLGGDANWGSQEVKRPPDARYRRRQQDGTPAVLRPASDSFLAPLITILHEVPAAKEMLLGRNGLKQNYDCGPEWWNGKAAWPENEQPDDGSRFWAETQRLTAFHDDTIRAYASTGPLEEILRDINDGNLMDMSFLKQKTLANMGKDPDALSSYLFSTEIQAPLDGDEPQDRIFHCLELQADSVVSDTGGSLIDIVDNALSQVASSDAADAGEGKTAYMVRVAEVVVFFVEPPGPGEKIGIKIPEEFHSGRWYEDAATSLDLQSARKDKYAIQEELKSIDTRRKALGAVYHPDIIGDEVSVPKLFDDLETYLKSRRQLESNSERNKEPQEDESASFAVVRQSINTKLSAIDKAKEEAMSSMHIVSKKLNDLRNAHEREQASNGQGAKYFLRGVGLSPTKFYVAAGKRDPEDLISNTEWQWWRLDASWYSPTGGWSKAENFNLQSSESSGQVAATIAKESTARIMLVYASEEAMEDISRPLPEPLQRFVKADNDAFNRESDPWADHSPTSTVAHRSEGYGSTDVQLDAPMTDVWAPIQEGAIRLESREDDDDDDNNNDGDDRGYDGDAEMRHGGYHYDASSSSGKDASSRPQPPRLPPRATPSSLLAAAASATPRPVATPSPPPPLPPPPPPASSKRKNALSAVKNALSRSKSRERTTKAAGAGDQEDLLVDNDEQNMGIPAMKMEGSKGRK